MSHLICVVTGSRAEYGLLRPLIRRLSEDDSINLLLVVTGAHLDQAFGETRKEILADGFPICAEIPVPTQIHTRAEMASAAGEAMSAFAGWFAQHRPELLIVLGDRYEIFGVAAAAAIQGIPIAHLHGGETTEGAVDEFIRHCITKMSLLHFVACEDYRRRVIQLGEHPERVFNVGALGVENSLHMPLLSEEEIRDRLSLGPGSYAVVTYHPETLGDQAVKNRLQELIGAMERCEDMQFVVTKSNADAGGREINEIWDREVGRHANWRVAGSLGALRYLSALKYARMMIGNSSSGIIEGPAMRIPTVNIGDRQKGRMSAKSVIDCTCDVESICRAIRRADRESFQELAGQVVSPYGDGNSSARIMRILKHFLGKGLPDVKKSFYDIV